MMAGVAMGMFRDYAESVEKCTSVTAVVRPIPQNVEIYNRGFENYRQIQKALAEVYHRMI